MDGQAEFWMSLDYLDFGDNMAGVPRKSIINKWMVKKRVSLYSFYMLILREGYLPDLTRLSEFQHLRYLNKLLPRRSSLTRLILRLGCNNDLGFPLGLITVSK